MNRIPMSLSLFIPFLAFGCGDSVSNLENKVKDQLNKLDAGLKEITGAAHDAGAHGDHLATGDGGTSSGGDGDDSSGGCPSCTKAQTCCDAVQNNPDSAEDCQVIGAAMSTCSFSPTEVDQSCASTHGTLYVDNPDVAACKTDTGCTAKLWGDEWGSKSVTYPCQFDSVSWSSGDTSFSIAGSPAYKGHTAPGSGDEAYVQFNYIFKGMPKVGTYGAAELADTSSFCVIDGTYSQDSTSGTFSVKITSVTPDPVSEGQYVVHGSLDCTAIDIHADADAGSPGTNHAHVDF
jgi:hypothetical protein